jgi:hypothetical protein
MALATLCSVLIGFTLQASASDERSIKTWVTKNVAGHGQIESELKPVLIDAGSLGTASGLRFYVVHFREFPVARMGPPPLASRNVFAVDAKGNVRLFTEPGALASAVAKMTVRASDAPAMRSFTVAWLNVSKEFSQDGFFKFKSPEKLVTSAAGKASGVVAVEPRSGDRGELTATLTFTKQRGGWVLASIREKRTIQAGVRPICQATKLLDPDPIVRRMAERDILIMGRAAKAYLVDQRKKASPNLQKAIDRIWSRVLNGER